MKVGLFGGTFNPIHTGHLIIGEWVRVELNLDTIFFIPTSLPPHKPDKNIIDVRYRHEMVKIAVEHDPHFEVSDYEMKNKNTYSIDTIMYFKESLRLSREEIYFIIGEDNLAQFDKWCFPEKVFEECIPVVVPRNFEKFKDKLNTMKTKFSDFILMKSPYLDISSTLVRKRIEERKSIKYLVPAGVEDYIIKHKLFC